MLVLIKKQCITTARYNKMKRIEEKARKIVREAFNDYLDCQHDTESSQYWYRIYATKMEMLKEIFPNTNEDQLEKVWYAMWKKGK